MSILIQPDLKFYLAQAISPSGIVTWSSAIERFSGSEVKKDGFLLRSQAWAWLNEMAHQ